MGKRKMPGAAFTKTHQTNRLQTDVQVQWLHKVVYLKWAYVATYFGEIKTTVELNKCG